MALSAGLAVLAMWAGLTFSYLFSVTPPSFSVVAAATVIYAAAEARGTVPVAILASRRRRGAGLEARRNRIAGEREHA
jgi:hypothetical protein